MISLVNISHVIYLFIIIYFLSKEVNACYFPIEYQGTFLIQTQSSPASGSPSSLPISPSNAHGPFLANEQELNTNVVTYSEITIEPDAIPPWGQCHKRRGNNVILKDSTGAEDCIRCFYLSLKTPNVIQIHTEDLARCYTSEEAARNKCPTERDVRDKKYKEIMLYRKHVPGGLQSVEHVFCPINGKFRFSYSGHNGQFYCGNTFSDISNCPHGNALSVRFRQCSFPNLDTNFLCLGDWENYSGDRYIALMDLREDPKTRPKYRCGMYKEDPVNGQIYLSLSADSTCTTQLKSATNGFESLILSPLKTNIIPFQFEPSKCHFPDWTQGTWENGKIEGNSFVFKDSNEQFRTLTSKCITRQQNTVNDRFIIQSTTQCNEKFYICIWMKRRSPNILEFQFGSQKKESYTESLCDDTQFTSPNWFTLGRKNIAIATPCPITGDYIGVVPGVTDLCAKVASDCNNPDIMFYTVSSCENRSHIYEEREYRCLGNWEEDGILYTFTQRRDMNGHQCFTGKIQKNGEEAFIKEAGESCIRGEDPLIFGMKITKQASCPRLLPVASYLPIRPSWPPRTDKVLQKTPYYTPIRHYPQQHPPQQQPSILSLPSSSSFTVPPPSIPRAKSFQPLIPNLRSPSTKDPRWYQQAEIVPNKSWKSISDSVNKVNFASKLQLNSLLLITIISIKLFHLILKI